MAIPAARDADPDRGHRATPSSPSRSPATSGSGSTSTSTQGVSFFSHARARQQRRAPARLRHRPEHGRRTTCSSVDNPLVVPAGTKVRLLLTAQDVIHAWWVPAFGMKKDAIPGFINEVWFRSRRQGRHLPRPVRRALRHGPRLHADRGRGEVAGRIRRLARRAEGRAPAGAPAAPAAQADPDCTTPIDAPSRERE